MLKQLLSIPAQLSSENAQTVRSSATYRAYRRNSLLAGLLLLMHTAVLIWDICHLVQYRVDTLTLSEVVFYLFYAVVMLPFFCYILWQQLRLLVRADRYVFREVLLDQPRAQNRAVIFHVVLPDEQGRNRPVETIPAPLTALDYVNQTALVGYNPETQLAVIIRPLHGSVPKQGGPHASV